LQSLKGLYEDYSDRVEILAIAASPIDDERSIRRYAERQGYPWDMVEFDVGLSNEYGINSHASAVVINGNGVITYRKGYPNSLSRSEWREVLDEVVGG
jgi:hypothetical protein